MLRIRERLREICGLGNHIALKNEKDRAASKIARAWHGLQSWCGRSPNTVICRWCAFNCAFERRLLRLPRLSNVGGRQFTASLAVYFMVMN